MRKFMPTNGYDRASINYSMITLFKPADIFRFFCLSLFRDEYYNVHITLEELSNVTGDKTLSSFNKHFKEFLDIKPYYVDNGFVFKTRRNVYHIPPMDLKCVTFSSRLAMVDLDPSYIGFFIQLVLISKFGNIELTRPQIIKLLKMDSKTYDKYVKELLGVLLFIDKGTLILNEEEFILETDFKYQKKFSKREREPISVPQFNFNKG